MCLSSHRHEEFAWRLREDGEGKYSGLTFVEAGSHEASRSSQENPENNRTGHQRTTVGWGEEAEASEDWRRGQESR